MDQNRLPGAAAPPRPPITDKSTIEAWAKQFYLDWNHHNQHVTINVQDFLSIITTGGRDRQGWLTEDQVSLPMILTADLNKELQMLVVDTVAGASLANVGLGNQTRDGFLDFRPGMYEAMDHENIRWIVVPCSDGMGGDAELEKRFKQTKELPENAGKPDKEIWDKVYGHAGQGKHWGFMVIDKQTSEARWLDGDLTIGRRNGRHHIDHMYEAGWVAGKALCGFDTVMRRERGQFTATTLKHVPHDHSNNSFKGDQSASCGPWVFAMLRYLVANPQFLRDEAGLKGTFTHDKKATHVQRMAYNSLETRHAMQRVIRDEVERQDPNALPYKLTAPIMKILDIPDASRLLNSVHGILRNSRPSRPKAAKTDPKKKDDHSSGDEDDDGFGNSGVPRRQLRDMIREDPAMYRDLPDKTARYRLALTNLRDQQQAAFDRKADAEEAKKEKGVKKKNAEDAKRNAQNVKRKNAKDAELKARNEGIHSIGWVVRYPEGFSGTNLPDFSTLWNSQSQLWSQFYKGDLFFQKRTKGLHYHTTRTMMHATYKGTFYTESPAALMRHIMDPVAFDRSETGKQWTAQALAARLDHTYVTLATPECFAALSEEEIDEWVKNLPPTAEQMVQDPKDKNKTSYATARGLLHRMFKGSFDTMSAEDVTAWAKADPSVRETYEGDNETAMAVMKALYDGEDTRNLPYLRRSPLHWPDRKWRAQRGEKRKRDDSDAGKKPAKALKGDSTKVPKPSMESTAPRPTTSLTANNVVDGPATVSNPKKK